MERYKKISELDVYLLIRGIHIDPMTCGYGISAKNIAFLLKTSIYQVRKHLKNLKEVGAVDLCTIKDVCTCYEYCECEATGLIYKKWIFNNDLTKYKEYNESQSEEYKKAFNGMKKRGK